MVMIWMTLSPTSKRRKKSHEGEANNGKSSSNSLAFSIRRTSSRCEKLLRVDFVPDGEVTRGRQRVHQPGVPYPYKRSIREASTIPIVSAVALEPSTEGGDEEFRRRYEEERVSQLIEE